VLAALIGARRMPLLAVLSVAIFIIYSIEPIKTYRYFYPALPFIVVLAGLGTSEVLIRLNGIFPDKKRMMAAAAIAVWPITSAALAMSDHFQVYLHKDGAVLKAFDEVGKKPDLCGVAIIGLEWWRTGGYTHLHRNIPMFEIDRSEESRYAPGYNYVISQDQIMNVPGYEIERCTPNMGFSPATRGAICIYRRPGRCAPLQPPNFMSLEDSRSF
jgi:hypothetical protein